jgi:nitrous oxide reductase
MSDTTMERVSRREFLGSGAAIATVAAAGVTLAGCATGAMPSASPGCAC